MFVGGGKGVRYSCGSQRLQADWFAYLLTLWGLYVWFIFAVRLTQFIIVRATNGVHISVEAQTYVLTSSTVHVLRLLAYLTSGFPGGTARHGSTPVHESLKSATSSDTAEVTPRPLRQWTTHAAADAEC